MILPVGNQNKKVAKPLKAKTWMIMKLTIALLLFFTFQVSAKSNAQKITIVKNNIHLSEVFRDIERQTGYLFFYDKALIKNTDPIDVSIKNATIDQALSACLKGEQLTYSIVRNTIVIQPLNIGNKLEVPQLANIPPPIEIHGRVRDENGNPLPGASITIKGTLTGVTSDANGDFAIEVPDIKTVLLVSFTGYVSQEIPIGSRLRIDVNLIRVDNSLNEVVVTALGVKKLKRGLVYAAAEIKGSDLTEARDNNVASALTGKIAGVDATQIASGPGGSSRVIIRGVGAINGSANNQPLYIVNGSPIYNGNGGAAASSTGFNYDTGDGISSINPDDIESITVLKSGAAAALYGSQAANGVILITTKSGKAQKGIGVDLNSNYLTGTPSTYPNYQYEYGSGNDGVKPATQAAALSAGRLSYGAKMDGSMVVQFDGVERPYSPVKVKDNVNNFYRPSTNFTNTIAFYGGSNALNFRLSLSDLDAKAQTPNSTFGRKTSNLSVTSHLGKNDFITIEGNAQYNYEKGHNRPNVGYAELNPSWATYLLGNTVDIRSLAPGYNDNGDEIQWNPVPAAPNPWFVVNKTGNEDIRNRFIGSGSVQINFLSNLFVKGIISKDFIFSNRYNFTPIGTAFTPKGYYNSYEDQFDISNARATLNYNTKFLKDCNYSG